MKTNKTIKLVNHLSKSKKKTLSVNKEQTFKIDNYEFSLSALGNANAALLLICADPTPEQERILNILDVKILDNNGKKFYPKDDKR